MDEKCNKEKIIRVNKQEIKVTEDQLTGREILKKCSVDPGQNDLFLVIGLDSKKIEPDTVVKIQDGLIFHIICRIVPYG